MMTLEGILHGAEAIKESEMISKGRGSKIESATILKVPVALSLSQDRRMYHCTFVPRLHLCHCEVAQMFHTVMDAGHRLETS